MMFISSIHFHHKWTSVQMVSPYLVIENFRLSLLVDFICFAEMFDNV